MWITFLSLEPECQRVRRVVRPWWYVRGLGLRRSTGVASPRRL